MRNITANVMTAPSGKGAVRNIWIPNMTPEKLSRLLAKTAHSANDVEDLKDFKQFLTTDEQSAVEKGFMVPYNADGGPIWVLKNKYWMTNIEAAIATGEKRDKALAEFVTARTPQED